MSEGEWNMSKSTGVNSTQVGGDHYKTAETQHWDVMADYHVHYLCANATKYIVRARRKNGAQDYEKALHYIEKAIDWLGVPAETSSSWRLMPHDVPVKVVYELAQAYQLSEDEIDVLFLLLSDSATARELSKARDIVTRMIYKLSAPVVEDCSLHALQPPDRDDA